ncbi:MAG: hypothetical protein VCC01_15180 [Candidatus Hydrogenedentota bacterium]
MFVFLIVAIRFTNSETVLILPDDREAIEHKRLDRENNAYYTMVEAAIALPQRPQPKSEPDREKPQFKTLYSPLRNSMGALVGVTRPDDHPDFLQYLRDAGPALYIAESMLEKEYFLYEYPVVNQHHRLTLPPPIDLQPVFAVWLAYGNAQALFWNEGDKCTETFSNIFLARRLTSKQIPFGYPGQYRWNDYYKTLMAIVRKTDDINTIDNIQEMLEAQPLPFDDMVSVLHSVLLMFDDTLDTPATLEKRGTGLDMGPDDHLYLMFVQKAALFIRDELSALEELAPKPVTEYSRWLESNDWASVPFATYMDAHFILGAMRVLEAAHRANAMQTITLLVIAVERYQKDNGQYPPELEDLIPKYIDAAPLSPATLAPLQYERFEDSYAIFDQEIKYFGYDGKLSGTRLVEYVTKKDFPEFTE